MVYINWICKKAFRHLKNVFLNFLSNVLETLLPLRCLFKMTKQRFCYTLFRFAKKLSFTHLENISERCLIVLAKELLDLCCRCFLAQWVYSWRRLSFTSFPAPIAVFWTLISFRDLSIFQSIKTDLFEWLKSGRSRKKFSCTETKWLLLKFCST